MDGAVISRAVEGTGFVFTHEMDFKAQMASIAGSCISLLLSIFIVGASAWIYSVPSARHHLNRVSFRLFLWSTVVEIVYNCVYIYIFSDPIPRTANAASCGAVFYLLVATMGMANWLCTFIGVNLMLAICFGVNSVRARLERWYIAISFVLGFGVTLVPAALGHFGVDNVYDACYFTQTNDRLRIRDYVLDLYLWQLLSALVAAGSVLAVCIQFSPARVNAYLCRALFHANGLNLTCRDRRDSSGVSNISSHPHSSIQHTLSRPLRLLRRGTIHQSTASLHRIEDKFIRIALKVSLYPLALILINSFITAEDLAYTVRGGVNSRTEYASYCIYYFLYGGRGLFFALLGIFVDPCLRKGLPAAYSASFHPIPNTRPILPTSVVNQIPDDKSNTDVESGESWTEFMESTTQGHDSQSTMRDGKHQWGGEHQMLSAPTVDLGGGYPGGNGGGLETGPASPPASSGVQAFDTIVLDRSTAEFEMPTITYPFPSHSSFRPSHPSLPTAPAQNLFPPPSILPLLLARSRSDPNTPQWAESQSSIPVAPLVLEHRKFLAAAEKMYIEAQAQI